MRSFLRPAAAALAVLLLSASPAAAAPGPWSRTPSSGWAGPAAGAAKPAPAVVDVGRDALARALERGRIDEATYALERARSLFDLAGVRARYGADVRRPDPRAATLVLRDLVLRLRDLTAAERAEARSILARPTDGAADPQKDGYSVSEEPPFCSTNGCVHYVASTPDAPDLTDTDPADGIPDYVETASAVLEEVWATEVTELGYRRPKSDLTSANNGGDGRIDVYLANLGDEGLYGYCTTDDPNAIDPNSTYRYYDFSAYCVVDNDYAEFPAPSNGIRGLKVTMAHELFHAVQFAYDAAEDAWFMESTATWMEDEAYDRINDNRQYLPYGPLGRPRVSLDLNRGYAVYGAWIWPRFLVETGEDVDIIRRVWRKAAAAPGDRDMYSLQAYAAVIAALGARFRWAFADFGMYNAAPAALYEEGRSYPTPPDDERIRITSWNGGAAGSELLDHLTNAYVRLTPGGGVSSTARLAVSLDGPPRRTGTEASVVVFFTGGRVRFVPLPVNRRGDTSTVVPFKAGRIARVEVVMTNASMRRDGGCWRDPRRRYACWAYPRDDDLRFRYAVTLIQ
jgi:hypothetical protein